MKRTIIITGGAGFIGNHVVRLFVNKYPEYDIINLDKLTYAGNLANLKDVEDKPNYKFVKMDICDFEGVYQLMQDAHVDGIIHLAAESHVDRSIKDPFTFARTNVMGTLSLLQAAKTGVKAVACKLCGVKTYIKVVDPAVEAEKEKAKAAAKKSAKPAKAKKQEEKDEEPVKTMKVRSKDKNQRSTGMLTWGNIFRRKKFVLHEGSYLIGRKDSACPSDIEFDDEEMSRRSVLLDVIQKNDGFYYKLTVKKAMNPVLHNNKELEEQESVYLNFGDAFQLGRTVINFKKADK